MVKELDGWKEIAAAMCVGVRTAERWRVTSGLPVIVGFNGRVSADPVRLVSWLAERGRPWRNTPLVAAVPSMAMVST
jgi:hypothetical protein